jgi:hypothetical protein
MSFAQVLLTNVTANNDTNKAILNMLELPEEKEVQYHVYEVAYNEKQLFCCLSGGLIDNNEIQFTPVGLGAFEAMTNIQTESEPEYFAEFISLENGDLWAQIEEVFERVPDQSRICFVGDLNDDLKLQLAKYFTLVH